MKFIVLDFETFYDTANGYSLRKLSAPEYIGDERFKVHNLGVRLNGKTKILWGDDEIRPWLDGWRKYAGDYAFVMHNASFDAAILAWHYDFVPKYMVDTLFLANHVLGPKKDSGSDNSLAGIAKLLGIKPKGRLDFMDGVRDPTPGEKLKLTEYLGGDLEITETVLNTLLPHVTNPDLEMWLMDHTIKIYATRTLDLDWATVDRAEKLIATRRQEAVDRLMAVHDWPFTKEEAPDILTSDKQFKPILEAELQRYGVPMPTKLRKTTANEIKVHAKKLAEIKLVDAVLQSGAEAPADVIVNGPRAIAKWQKWARKIGDNAHNVPDELPKLKTVPALSKQDEAFIGLSYSEHEGLAALVKARLIEKSSDTSQSRITSMRRVAGNGIGRMPIHLNYYGARTGRYAGGGGFNFQNLTSPDRATDPGQAAIAAAIRESFIAPEGKVFVSADASQIEARITAWVAGQWDLVDQFARKEDVYSIFISDAIGRQITKKIKSEEEFNAGIGSIYDSYDAYARDMKLMRAVGKESILGLGFGMAAPKFEVRLRSNSDIAKMYARGEFVPCPKRTGGKKRSKTEQPCFAETIVKTYREKNTEIVNTWADLNSAFFVAKDRGVKEVGPVRFRGGKGIGSTLPVVHIDLPSGRSLNYRNIRKVSNPDRRDGFEWKHGGGQKVYGGLLMENVAQAIARDVIVEAIVRAELDLQMPVILTVHDSIVGLAPEDKGEEFQRQLEESLRVTPEWASKRLVLDAEGKTAKTLVT